MLKQMMNEHLDFLRKGLSTGAGKQWLPKDRVSLRPKSATRQNHGETRSDRESPMLIGWQP